MPTQTAAHFHHHDVQVVTNRSDFEYQLAALECNIICGRQLLHCIWPSPDAKSPLQVLVAIEETYPGTIKSAEDANGNNALWFAVYLVSNWPDITSEIGKYFASCGCDLDKPFKAGFSWNTMARVITIIERNKQDQG